MELIERDLNILKLVGHFTFMTGRHIKGTSINYMAYDYPLWLN